jgi:PKD repeat protein
MHLPPGSTQDQAFTASDPDGDALTFSKDFGPSFMTVTTLSPTTGNIHLAPASGTTGNYIARVAASDGTISGIQSFQIRMCGPCLQPVFAPVSDMTVTEGMTADQAISATLSSGSPLDFRKGVGPTFMTVSTTNSGSGTATGNIHLAPGLGDVGTYLATVRVHTGPVFVQQMFTITVVSGNRCPTASPGGPYSGLTAVPIGFDGSASSDPEGSPLTYAWDFDASNGVTVDATGPLASHTYAAAGAFTVTLTVADNGDGYPARICSSSATTTATINAACAATVFNGYDTIKLNSGKPYWFAYVQPASTCYNNSDVVIPSFVMKYAGRQISASGKTAIVGDKSGDGIQEIKISFLKEDLRTLFTGTGLANGHNTVTVTLEANLATGGRLSGTTQLDVVNNGAFNVAVSPNPLNPQATLTWTTSKAGFARIEMFDVQGRLVRRLVDEIAMAAGTHEATIDGRNQRGGSLPSGVYFIRGTLAEGDFKQIITILK